MSNVNRRIFVMSLASAGLAACSAGGAVAPSVSRNGAFARRRSRQCPSAMPFTISNQSGMPALSNNIYVISSNGQYLTQTGTWSALGSSSPAPLTAADFATIGLPPDPAGGTVTVYLSAAALPLTSANAGILQPWNNDGSQGILFDWFYYTWANQGAVVTVASNPYMFALPLFIAVEPTSANLTWVKPPVYGSRIAGIGVKHPNAAWSSITSGLQSAGSPWTNCIVKNGSQIVRVLSPGNAPNQDAFDDYFQTYLEQVQQYYLSSSGQPTGQIQTKFGLYGFYYSGSEFVFTPPPYCKGFTLSNSYLQASKNVYGYYGQQLPPANVPGKAAAQAFYLFMAGLNRSVLTLVPAQPVYNSAYFYESQFNTNAYADLLHANFRYHLANGFPQVEEGSYGGLVQNNSGCASIEVTIGEPSA